MKRKICGIVFAICMVLVFGVMGKIECGEPMCNIWWCIPLLATMWASGRIGGFLK